MRIVDLNTGEVIEQDAEEVKKAERIEPAKRNMTAAEQEERRNDILKILGGKRNGIL